MLKVNGYIYSELEFKRDSSATQYKNVFRYDLWYTEERI